MKEYIAVRHEEELIIERGLVRCKDCKHYQKFSTCNHIEGAKDDPNWFCADGEMEEQ